MTGRDRLAALGRRVEAADGRAEAQAIARLRLLDPAYAPTAEDAERELAERHWQRDCNARRGGSGWQRGTPQCHACRRILPGYGAWCPDCRHYSDRHRG